ncbi:nuclear transport factor 2 family protein [Catellatospora tritici]|uniref:nuclear transport factor 2 family protein n=1 Tax=Catellatospora tritici TaxID=2851566 RepID=UPI001C2CC7C2|nr:nuclear transport factor 2 family protein [Catellatospora tritici]MBV1856557.1 nuclear transport factor 2 family protein [Catellatospora tritici]
MENTGTAQRNKELVLHGFARFAAGDIEILRTLLHEDFLEHSPGNPSGRDAFIAYIANAPVAGAKLDLKRVVAEDDLVVMHYRMTTATEEVAVVDIWRLADGLIVEHWDVVQPVPAPFETPNGMF